MTDANDLNWDSPLDELRAAYSEAQEAAEKWRVEAEGAEEMLRAADQKAETLWVWILERELHEAEAEAAAAEAAELGDTEPVEAELTEEAAAATPEEEELEEGAAEAPGVDPEEGEEEPGGDPEATNGDERCPNSMDGCQCVLGAGHPGACFYEPGLLST